MYAWKDLITDKDVDSPDGNGSDNTEARDHNMANELLKQDLDNNGTYGLDYTDGATVDPYDDAGNMRKQKVGTESIRCRFGPINAIHSPGIRQQNARNTR